MDRVNGGRSLGPNPASAARAERYQDEKRRITESCFSKIEPDGSLAETYITHCRITEFSSHPSSPPPPDARTPQSEKQRVIIISVRKTGRVRLHKSKENSNGTFSIGKTWNMDDLSKIESYTGPDADPRFKEWAGTAGFTITLLKPYFWLTTAESEKKFFLASIIKIYARYTGGRLPEFVNFDPTLLHELQSADSRRQQGQSPIRGAQRDPPARQNTLQPGQPSPVPRAIPPQTDRSSPAGSMDSTRSLREQREAALRSLQGANKSQESLAPSFRSDDGGAAAAAVAAVAAAATPKSRNGLPFLARSIESPESPPPPPQFQPQRIATPPQDEHPPERRRPPMDPTRPGSSMDKDLVPAPLAPASLGSPPLRREPTSIPPRSRDRSRKNSVAQRSETTSLASIKDSLLNRHTPAPSESSKFELPKDPSPEPALESGASPPPQPPETSESPTARGEELRPGLGPMIKSKMSKGDLTTRWKAATAAATAAATSIAAFKPRPGGAGERLRQVVPKTGNEPDGITSVVPAPPRPAPISESQAKTPEVASASNVPQVTITGTSTSRPTSVQSPPDGKNAQTSADPNKADEAARAKEEARRDVVVGNDAKYLRALGVDPSILDKRSAQFAQWLDFFGWVPGEQMRTKSMNEMQLDVERELNKAQAGGWIARFREEDERVEAIKRGLDIAMTECDEMDNLLTLYSVELSTLSDDIAYIEAQSQGLQVQTANQKLLRKELESLLETCAITAHDLDALRDRRLDNLEGLEEIEGSLVTLYKAMIKIDPSLGGSESRKSDDMGEEADQASGLLGDYGNMRIVREKKAMYVQESAVFLRRMAEFMTRQFDVACSETSRALDGALSKKIDPRHHDAGRNVLWRYSPIMLYAREVDLDTWNGIMLKYQDRNHPMYRAEFREVLELWKRNTRPPAADEGSDVLFASQIEKRDEKESMAAAARKLTVKKSQNLARGLRNQLQDGNSKVSVDKGLPDNRSLPYEIFVGVVDDMLPLVEMEQNFIIDFFHATTLEHRDFPECAHFARPEDRRIGDLRRDRKMEPDRELARRVTRAMEVIFAVLEQDLQNLMEWVLGSDPLQGVGVLAILNRKLADLARSNQEFLTGLLQKLHGHLEGKFMKFVDQQIMAVEETKIQIHKRKGVISFIRVFPLFSAAVETMMEGVDPTLSVRHTIDGEYDRILKSMFSKLKAIARDTAGGGGVSGSGNSGGEAEDKEAINYHILFIDNMNHFIEETDQNGLAVLREWRTTANTELAEHMKLYVYAIVRRPLGKLLDYIENIEAQLQSGKSGAAIAAQPSNSRNTFNKIMGQYEAKEIRKGIEALRKRVEKHFGDAEEQGHGLGVKAAVGSVGIGMGTTAVGSASSQALVNRVLRECDRFYADVDARINEITTHVYGGESLWEFPRAEAKNSFAIQPTRQFLG